MLDFGIRISGLLRTDREKAPHTWIFVQAWGASFLSAAQDDVEKEEDGQLHCQNDSFQIHHR